ncbi:potassium/proton antiporter [Motilimonas pumila]|uniref:Potassium/proton antiporter n=1 Tax=Motilimonas pumila TaxID=2303987 RepID=A0A418YHU4_9GAMM|nr:potassium/proton antiporter [Motilimonas pumila]RJG49529.1 potassium/proton antiporter [Motilimonas pumila]
MTLEIGMLGLAILVAVGILLHQPSKTLGIPSLLIFMGVGLAFGNGEFDFTYDNLGLTSLVGSIALNMIVFVGGLNTSTQSIRLAWREGGVLSSFGVLFTSIIFALLMHYLFAIDLLWCLLFAAVVSSTDAAAVFSILESKKLKLKENTDTILEFESATNDPVALLMVILLTDIIMSQGAGQTDAWSIATILSQQIVVGIAMGGLLAWLSVVALNSIKLEEYGLIPVYVLACFMMIMQSTELLGGNVLIALYIGGVVIGNSISRGREVNKHFYNSLSWLAQSLMFVILGLQIFPQSLAEVFWVSLFPAVLLCVVARPLAVQLCYLPFWRASWRKRLFISSIGLKGATPIVFALIPATAGVEGSMNMVHMVFFVVLFSVCVQGSLIEPLAKKLDLVDK